ncbi:cell division protein SepF [Bacillus cereus]|nr:cell division protein SepF [Bacillus cereus]
MAKQLNIFDVEPEIMQFNVSKAKVKRGTGKITYADVRVLIPREAKGTDELPRTTKASESYEVFEEHTIGVWRYQRARDKSFNWETAEELCKAARDHKEAIPVRVHLGTGFIPSNVVEYLK